MPFLFAVELTGIVAFAVSGVLVAIERRLDLFGALVLGAITSVGGGLTRDIMIGHTPPVMFTDPIYAMLAVLVSLIVFAIAYFFGNRINLHSKRWAQIINFFDALGLGVFVTTGVDAVLTGDLAGNAFLAIFAGTVSGVGGGLLRDLFTATIPAIFRKHVYALAAIAGSAAYYFMRTAAFPIAVALPITVTGVVLIRVLAAHYRWNFPMSLKKYRNCRIDSCHLIIQLPSCELSQFENLSEQQMRLRQITPNPFHCDACCHLIEKRVVQKNIRNY